MEDGTKIKKSTLADDSTLDEEELVEVEDLESLLTQNEDDEIGSSSEEKQGPLQLLLAKGKKEGFITYAELNEQLPKGIVEADRLEEIVDMINDLGISVQERASIPWKSQMPSLLTLTLGIQLNLKLGKQPTQ